MNNNIGSNSNSRYQSSFCDYWNPRSIIIGREDKARDNLAKISLLSKEALGGQNWSFWNQKLTFCVSNDRNELGKIDLESDNIIRSSKWLFKSVFNEWDENIENLGAFAQYLKEGFANEVKYSDIKLLEGALKGLQQLKSIYNPTENSWFQNQDIKQQHREIIEQAIIVLKDLESKAPHAHLKNCMPAFLNCFNPENEQEQAEIEENIRPFFENLNDSKKEELLLYISQISSQEEKKELLEIAKPYAQKILSASPHLQTNNVLLNLMKFSREQRKEVIQILSCLSLSSNHWPEETIQEIKELLQMASKNKENIKDFTNKFIGKVNEYVPYFEYSSFSSQLQLINTIANKFNSNPSLLEHILKTTDRFIYEALRYEERNTKMYFWNFIASEQYSSRMIAEIVLEKSRGASSIVKELLAKIISETSPGNRETIMRMLDRYISELKPAKPFDDSKVLERLQCIAEMSPKKREFFLKICDKNNETRIFDVLLKISKESSDYKGAKISPDDLNKFLDVAFSIKIKPSLKSINEVDTLNFLMIFDDNSLSKENCHQILDLISNVHLLFNIPPFNSLDTINQQLILNCFLNKNILNHTHEIKNLSFLISSPEELVWVKNLTSNQRLQLLTLEFDIKSSKEMQSLTSSQRIKFFNFYLKIPPNQQDKIDFHKLSKLYTHFQETGFLNIIETIMPQSYEKLIIDFAQKNEMDLMDPTSVFKKQILESNGPAAQSLKCFFQIPSDKQNIILEICKKSSGFAERFIKGLLNFSSNPEDLNKIIEIGLSIKPGGFHDFMGLMLFCQNLSANESLSILNLLSKLSFSNLEVSEQQQVLGSITINPKFTKEILNSSFLISSLEELLWVEVLVKRTDGFKINRFEKQITESIALKNRTPAERISFMEFLIKIPDQIDSFDFNKLVDLYLQDINFFMNIEKIFPLNFGEIVIEIMKNDRLSIRETTNNYLQQLLESDLMPQVKHKIATQIMNNLIELNLHDEDPLVQSAIQTIILCNPEALEKPKNPFRIYQLLKDAISNEKQIEVSEMKDWNISTLREKGKRVVYTQADLPSEVSPNSLPVLFETLRTRINSLAEPDKKEALDSISSLSGGKSLEKVINDFFSLGFTQNLLFNSGTITSTKVQFFAIIKAILEADDTVKEGSPLSSREEMLIGMATMIQACTTGQRDGINRYYQDLPVKYKTVNAKIEMSPPEQFVDGVIQDTLKEIISQHLPHEIDPTDSQGSHASLYLLNRYAFQVGLRHELTFDQYTGVLSDKVLNKKPQEIISRIFSHFTVEKMIKNLIRASAEHFNAGPQETKKFYSDILKFMGEKVRIDTCFEVDEDFKLISLTEEGARALLKETGYLK